MARDHEDLSTRKLKRDHIRHMKRMWRWKARMDKRLLQYSRYHPSFTYARDQYQNQYEKYQDTKKVLISRGWTA